jgi:hypothetical protein
VANIQVPIGASVQNEIRIDSPYRLVHNLSVSSATHQTTQSMRGLFLWREYAPCKLAEHELRRLEHPAKESSRPLLSGGMEHERAQSINRRRTGSDQMVQKSISRLGLVVSDVQPLPTRRAQHICFPCQIIPIPVVTASQARPLNVLVPFLTRS